MEEEYKEIDTGAQPAEETQSAVGAEPAGDVLPADEVQPVTAEDVQPAEEVQSAGEAQSAEDVQPAEQVPNADEAQPVPERIDIDLSQGRGSKLVYINVAPPEEDEDAFWNEVLAVKPLKSTGKRVLWIVLLVLLVLCILGYTFLLQHGKGLFKSLLPLGERIEFTLPIAETPTLDEKYTQADGSYSAAGLAKAVLPSVVQIKAYTTNAVRASSQGSGIILSDDGYIVTNAHVISDAELGVTVMLYDRSEYAAKVVGKDDSSDIAVLKISTRGLTAAQFADSDTCELGDEVVAIGSPAGFENSVTKGIVSGLERQIHAENSAVAMQCIQIDAAINPGNSGGPLFNMWGQVVGITSSKLVATSYDNIGFAITVNSAKPIIEGLIEDGYIPDRGRIGIIYSSISEEAAKMYGVVAGLYIREIDADCDVANTELKAGDIITEIGGVSVSTQQNVNTVLDGHRAGDRIKCKVYRPKPVEGKEGQFDGGEYFEIEFELAKDKNSMIEKN